MHYCTALPVLNCTRLLLLVYHVTTSSIKGYYQCTSYYTHLGLTRPTNGYYYQCTVLLKHWNITTSVQCQYNQALCTRLILLVQCYYNLVYRVTALLGHSVTTTSVQDYYYSCTVLLPLLLYSVTTTGVQCYYYQCKGLLLLAEKVATTSGQCYYYYQYGQGYYYYKSTVLGHTIASVQGYYCQYYRVTTTCVQCYNYTTLHGFTTTSVQGYYALVYIDQCNYY